MCAADVIAVAMRVNDQREIGDAHIVRVNQIERVLGVRCVTGINQHWRFAAQQQTVAVEPAARDKANVVREAHRRFNWTRMHTREAFH